MKITLLALAALSWGLSLWLALGIRHDLSALGVVLCFVAGCFLLSAGADSK